MTRADLCKVSGVSAETIKNIEVGRWEPRHDTIEKIKQTLSEKGVGFADGGIYRIRKNCPKCGAPLPKQT